MQSLVDCFFAAGVAVNPWGSSLVLPLYGVASWENSSSDPVASRVIQSTANVLAGTSVAVGGWVLSPLARSQCVPEEFVAAGVLLTTLAPSMLRCVGAVVASHTQG